MAISMFVGSVKRFIAYHYGVELTETVQDIDNPLTKYNSEMIVVSIGGLLLNLLGLFLFHEDEDVDQKNSNKYALFLHVLTDTLGSIGVLVTAYLIRTFQWYIADAICAIFISITVFISVLPLLKMCVEKIYQSTYIKED